MSGVILDVAVHMEINHSSGEGALSGVARCQTSMTAREFVSRAYEENRHVIYPYLVALGIEPSVAEDLTQELFLKLYVTVCKGKQIQNVRRWMFRVASHLALNHFRAENYHPSISCCDVGRWLESQAQPGVDPEKAVLEREKAVTLQEVISSLSAQQKVCLHLRAEGFRYREIANILGVTIPTVAEFLRRAVSKLKRAAL